MSPPSLAKESGRVPSSPGLHRLCRASPRGSHGSHHPLPSLQDCVPAICPQGQYCQPPTSPSPLQEGLPEGREDAVIVVPGGRQVGPARVSGVEAPCSLVVWEEGEGGGGGPGIGEAPLPPKEPRLQAS